METREYLIEGAGRKEIRNVLTSTGPAEAILQLQNLLRLPTPNIEPALQFLDMLQVPRSTVYHYLLDKLRESLINSIKTMPPQKLEYLLKPAFKFITVRDLKAVPITIVSSLPKIPPAYLKALADKRLREIFNEFPIGVKKQVWEIYTDFFLEEMEPLLVSFSTETTAESRKLDPRFRNFCEIVGSSEKLFRIMCNKLSNRIVSGETSELKLSSVLRQMLLVTDELGKKFKIFGKLYELARNLDDWVLNSVSNIPLMVELLKSIIASYVTRAAQSQLPSASRALLPVLKNKVIPPTKIYPPASTVVQNLHTVSPAISEKSIATTVTKTIHSTPLAPNRASRKDSNMPRTSKDVATPNAEPVSVQPPSMSFPEKNLITLTVEAGALEDALKNAWSILSDIDKKTDRIFAFPVTDDIAPSYSQIIKNPMDFSTIQSKLANFIYRDLTELDADVNLIVSNCLSYNGPVGYFSEAAKKLLKLWNSKKTNLNKYPASSKAKKVAAEESLSKQSTYADGIPVAKSDAAKNSALEDVASVASAISDAPIVVGSGSSHADQQSVVSPTSKAPVPAVSRNVLLKNLEAAWDIVSSLDSNGIFAAPVTDDIAPSYSKVIARPMDLSTIQAKLFKYRSFRDFDADVTLMCENCHQYNGIGSYYSGVAAKLQQLWRKNSIPIRVALGEPLPEEEDKKDMDVEEDEPSSSDSSDDHETSSDDSGFSSDSFSGNHSRKRKAMNNMSEAVRRDTDLDSTVHQNDILMDAATEPAPKKARTIMEPPSAPTVSSVINIKDLPAPPQPKVTSANVSTVKTSSMKSFADRNVSSAAAQRKHQQNLIVGELQAMRADGMLLWAIALCFDPNILHALEHKLCGAMIKAFSDPISKLPMDDSQCRLLLQLCEFTAATGPRIPALSQHYLRRVMPHMMLNCSNEESIRNCLSVVSENEFMESEELNFNKMNKIMMDVGMIMAKKSTSKATSSSQFISNSGI